MEQFPDSQISLAQNTPRKPWEERALAIHPWPCVQHSNDASGWLGMFGLQFDKAIQMHTRIGRLLIKGVLRRPGNASKHLLTYRLSEGFGNKSQGFKGLIQRMKYSLTLGLLEVKFLLCG